ncbi:hypothetical protein AVEN_95268-1 [Araneus ventricosus]|uniref:Uncharacterized protein n=1 Tax=Araneus ventricosus TaxID=182803 RepID=A0A4Y2DHZ6_ARAVE|nr:hypothetical protein AVEN_95268-1 [Araneus ventricosus]
MGRPLVFLEEQEKLLTDRVSILANFFYGITIEDLKHLAFQLVEELKIKHNFNGETKTPNRIFNVAETGTSSVQKPLPILKLEIHSKTTPSQMAGHGGLVARSRLWGLKVPGSKSDSTEDPPCMGPAAR